MHPSFCETGEQPNPSWSSPHLLTWMLLAAVQDSHFFLWWAKIQRKFECKTDIPAIPGDDLACGVACLQFMNSSVGVWHFVKGKFYCTRIFQQWEILQTMIFDFCSLMLVSQ